MTKSNEVPPELKDEIITVQLHEKDLQALVQLLNVTQDVYNKVVDNAVKASDEKSTTLFLARAKLAGAFSERLNEYLDFAEPKSKELH